MKRHIAMATAALAAVTAGAAALGADAPEYPNTNHGSISKEHDWYGQCLRVEKAAPPAKDLPPAQSAAFRDCDAEALYYDSKSHAGAGQPNWQQVRHCAFAKADDSVLMMLYANGSGVTRHLDLALKYACSLKSASMEMRFRVDHLLALAKSGKAETFDFCDDVTSGNDQALCAMIVERQRAKVRKKQLDSLAKAWPAQHQAALDKLQLALDKFADASSRNEIDSHGSMAAGAAVLARADEAKRFVQDIRDFEQGKTPRHSEAQLAAADQQLNAVYQKIMRLPATKDGGIYDYTTVTKDNVKQTQRAWLKYRDALVAFGAVKYPAVPASAWKGLLTQRRVEQLTELATN